jgi:DNA polymerase
LPRFATLADLHAHVAATSPGAPLADGNPQAGLLVIGEAPSAEDLRNGRPFSGPAGRLLDRMLAAIGLDRSLAYITLLAPRLGVPGPPSDDAVAADLPLTLEHLRLVAPRLVLLLGAIPTRVLTGDATPISRTRGRFTRVTAGGLEVAALPTYNPAFLLRQPAAKREAWSDLLQLKARLEKAGLAMTGTKA